MAEAARLHRLGLFHAALAALDRVTRAGAAHPSFDASARWLAVIAERIPEPSGVVRALERHPPGRLERTAAALTPARADRVRYLMGREAYRDGRFADALALLARVPDASPFGLEARFVEGASHVRRRDPEAAEHAFRRVVEASASGSTHADATRRRDLAWMSLGRLRYSRAMRLAPSARAPALARALDAWRQVPLARPHGPEAFFEETWALYASRDLERALGHLHALDAPALRPRADPEALVLRAMIQLEHCQWDAAEAAVDAFHRRYDATTRGAERALTMAARDGDAFRMLLAVRARRARVPEAARRRVEAALDDPEIVRHVIQVASIDAERRRLHVIPRGALPSSRARIEADLVEARGDAITRAADATRTRLRDLVATLHARARAMDTVEVELTAARRAELRRPNPRPMSPPSGGRVVAIQGAQVWPFEGEWWPDELERFRQEIHSRCAP